MTIPTPSAGTTTIAYDTDGVIKQKDPPGTITVISGSGGLSLLKITGISYTQWQPQKGGTQTAFATVGQLPAAAIPVSFKIKQSAAFVGGSTVLVYLADFADATISSVSNDLSQAPGNNIGCFGSIIGTPSLPDVTAPSNLNVQLSVSKGYDINSLTAGTFDLWIWYTIGS